jgi:molybdopterin-guanine dinucleotide biosynthesis protein A
MPSPHAQPVGKALGAVLAGGRGTRLGQPKPSARVGGRALIDYPLAALQAAGVETVVVAKPRSPLPVLPVEIWEEPAEPAHPLCGIVRALQGGRPVLVVGCDMPLITPAAVSWLAGLPGPLAVPGVGGRLHPLLARYDPELAGPLERALRHRAPLQAAIRELRPRVLGAAEIRRFGDPDRLLFNVNTPEDLAEAERLLNA